MIAHHMRHQKVLHVDAFSALCRRFMLTLNVNLTANHARSDVRKSKMTGVGKKPAGLRLLLPGIQACDISFFKRGGIETRFFLISTFHCHADTSV